MSGTEHLPDIDGERNFTMLKIKYFILLAIAAILVVIAFMNGHASSIALDVWIILLLCCLLFFNRYVVYIPPFLIGSIVICTYISLISCFFGESIWSSLTSLLTGYVLGVIGIIQAYIILGKKPNTNKERSNIITTVGFNFAVAIYSIGVVLAFVRTAVVDVDFFDYMHKLMARSAFNAIGALITCLLYYYGFSRGFFDKSIKKFVDRNAQSFGIIVSDEEKIEQLILAGESYNLEFKSTLCLNLNTGKKDKRMEKAVLKSLVAFLNSDGGVLLVGVEDNGNILGVDIEEFDNRDKMNLHITNLITSQIGSEFLPFINFRMVDFGKKENGADRVVIIFECTPTKSPVFFKDPKEKQEIYFVRSGPSTIELSGLDLLKYIDHRNGNDRTLFKKKKSYAGEASIQTDSKLPAEETVPDDEDTKKE